MRKLIHTLFFVASMVMTLPLFAQEEEVDDCTNKLKDAQTLYEQGLLERIPATLKNCMEEGFTKDQKLQAQRLLTLGYLFDDDYEKANEAMVDLLKMEPEYEVNPAQDPIEFIDLFNSYRTLPVFSFGFSAGSNYSIIERTAKFGVHPISNDAQNANTSKYKSQFGFVAGVNTKFYLLKNLELNLDLLFRINSSQYLGTQLFNFADLELTENQSWLYAPLSLTYDLLPKKQLHPYIRFGLGTGILISSDATNVERTYPNHNGQIATGPSIPLKDQRKNIYFWLTPGAGLKYRIRRGYFFFDLRYNYGLLNAVNTKNRYNNDDLTYKYYYVDDDFRQHGVSAMFGWVRSLYKPKKLKQKKVRKVKSNKKDE